MSVALQLISLAAMQLQPQSAINPVDRFVSAIKTREDLSRSEFAAVITPEDASRLRMMAECPSSKRRDFGDGRVAVSWDCSSRLDVNWVCAILDIRENRVSAVEVCKVVRPMPASDRPHDEWWVARTFLDQLNGRSGSNIFPAPHTISVETMVRGKATVKQLSFEAAKQLVGGCRHIGFSGGTGWDALHPARVRATAGWECSGRGPDERSLRATLTTAADGKSVDAVAFVVGGPPLLIVPPAPPAPRLISSSENLDA
ncbi:hypothetical protein [Sphingomonas psychrotolerans]|uniref:hypothetical protein n=1 Tax=Sphingomonas psychrotolerans TaxID=1327635 RepID=UPI00130536AC|nr:hypothetical protein [Sphingomonas psychrotolerans]